MGKIHKVFIVLILACVVVFLLIFLGVVFFGKNAVVDQLKQNLNTQVSLEKLEVSLPFNVYLRGISIGSCFKADSIRVAPNLFGLLAGKIVLDAVVITKPVITVEQSADGKLNLPVPVQKKGGNPPPVFLTGLKVLDGKIEFTDKKVSPEGFKVTADKVSVSINKVMWPPTSLNTNFSISAVLLDAKNKESGSINFSGWIDFGPKDMDAVLLVKGLEVTQFFPYLGNFISSRKLLSAQLDLTTQLKAKKNDLGTETNFKLAHLVYAPEVLPPAQEGQTQINAEAPVFAAVKDTLDLFADSNGTISFDFAYATELDNPVLDQEQLKKAMLMAAAKNLISQNPQELINKIGANAENFKAIGEQFKQMFKKKKEE